jgi:protein-disulfide isomerase
MPMTDINGRQSILAIAIGAAGVAAFLLFALLRPAPLAFAEREYPQGFRELVPGQFLSPLNPIAAMPQLSPLESAPKPQVRQICEALFRDPGTPVAGAGTMEVAAFFDYRCPYCKTLSGIFSSMPADSFRLGFHEWAILGDSSVLAARAALAADRQGKYAALHARLMNARLIPTPAYIDAVAAELGIDTVQLVRDMNAESITLSLRRTAALASALGFAGTPALVIGRTIVQGEISRGDLERLIEDESRPGIPRPC